jgi:hypothetical protein
VGAKNAKNGSEAEPKEVEHGGKVIAGQILISLISKADGIVTTHTFILRVYDVLARHSCQSGAI